MARWLSASGRSGAGSATSPRRHTPRVAWPCSWLTSPRKPYTNGVAGRSQTSRGEPTCSMRPAFIRTTRSVTSRASSWSWVTKTLATCSSSCSRRSQRRSSLRTLASSAPNGSSSSSTRGSTARARARAIRWRCPPESWAG
ncbi:Protein of uncharacterised function (DUF1602) [Bordetella pertussis]|nr:Protein of uncharacterised function (DUF1602) [Bordetella pertussis]